MIFVEIPFKDKNNGFPLVIICKGGHHPYHSLNLEGDRYDIIEDKWVFKTWDKNVDFLAPEWTAEIRISYGKMTHRMKCEGRDVFLLGKQPLQRLIHRKGDRAVNV